MTQQTVVTQQDVVYKAMDSAASKFSSSELVFDEERIFATQQLLNNETLLGAAKADPTSLKLAMHNVAAVGLSLNPALSLAYLVPRRPKQNAPMKVVLDISYKGLIQIGVEAGSIVAARPESVCKNDGFVYRGPFEQPIHKFNPFESLESRGGVIGVMCIAKLPNGSDMVEPMSLADINKIRDTSSAYKKGFGPWIDWPERMQLKCVVKRASNWWPRSSPRMAKAMDILNNENGEGIVLPPNNQSKVVALPEPPPRDVLSYTLQNQVSKMVSQAVETHGYEACKELMQDRFNDPSELSFALSELNSARKVAESMKSQMAAG